MSDIFHIMAAGQSNLIGGSAETDTSRNLEVEVWNPATNKWSLARINIGFDPVTGMDIGGNMVWSAAIAYQERYGGTVRLIMDGEGGRPVDDWLPTGDRLLDGARYDSLAAQYEAAGRPDIDLFVFVQGESNHDEAGSARTRIDTAPEYRQAIDTLFAELRADGLIARDTPIVMPELVDLGEASVFSDRNDVISGLDSDFDPFTWTAHADTGNAAHVSPWRAVHWNLEGLQYMGGQILAAYERAAAAADPLVETGPAAESFGAEDLVSYDSSPLGVAVNLHTGRAARGTASGDLLGPVSDVIGSQFADRMRGDWQANMLDGNAGRDFLHGGGGDDFIFGGHGVDFLNGDSGDDRIFGGDGADKLIGGAGHDQLSGGADADIFAFLAAHGVDVIADFEPGQDRIGLTAHRLYADMSFARLSSYLYEDGAGNTVLSTTRGENVNNMIILAGVELAELTADNFIL